MKKIKATFLLPNNMVATTGHDCQQIPELQGRYSIALHRRILKNSDENTEFNGFPELETEPDPLIAELMDLHYECVDLIEFRDIDGLNKLIGRYVGDGIDINYQKIILIVTKNVPEFIPEITDARKKLLDSFNSKKNNL